jgi:hypothetical protein
MGNPEDKVKKRYRIRSHIAKDLLTPKYHQRVVKDKRGRRHDLNKMDHKELVRLIQELNKDD